MHAQKSSFSIVAMVGLLGICRSGYYAWVGPVPSATVIRRILADLRADGETVSGKTVPWFSTNDLPAQVCAGFSA